MLSRKSDIIISRTFHSKYKSDATKNLRTGNSKEQDVHPLYNKSHDVSSASSIEDYLHSVFQLKKPRHKYAVIVVINGVSVDMEADLGAEHITIP